VRPSSQSSELAHKGEADGVSCADRPVIALPRRGAGDLAATTNASRLTPSAISAMAGRTNPSGVAEATYQQDNHGYKETARFMAPQGSGAPVILVDLRFAPVSAAV
jgi:hypothetical protein